MLHLIESSRNATSNYEDEYAENAALEASDFLLSMTSSSFIPEHLIEPYIKDMIPVLIQNLIFDQEKIEYLESTNDEVDSNIPDKEEDIKPTVGVTSITKKKKMFLLCFLLQNKLKKMLHVVLTADTFSFNLYVLL